MTPRYEQHEQLGLGSLIHCQTCPGDDYCGDGRTSHPCSLEYEPMGTERSRVLHPLRPDLGLRLADCKGLEFNVVARPQDLTELPRYIPCVSPRNFLTGALDFAAVAVPLDTVVSAAAQSTRRGLRIRDRLGLSPQTRLIIAGFANDRLLERAWVRRHRILGELADLRPDLVTGFGYSVYGCDPRLEHMYNMKRSLVTYQLWQAFGVPAVPCISWFSVDDLHRWCVWLHENTSVVTVAIDLQSADTSAAWEEAVSGLEFLHNNAPSTVSYLINGVANPNRVAALAQLTPRLHLCNQYPLLMAVQGHVTRTVGDVVQRIPSDAPRLEILLAEVENQVRAAAPVRDRATGVVHTA